MPDRLRKALPKLAVLAYPQRLATSLIRRRESARRAVALASRSSVRTPRKNAPVCSRNRCSKRQRLSPTCAAMPLAVRGSPQLERIALSTFWILGSISKGPRWRVGFSCSSDLEGAVLAKRGPTIFLQFFREYRSSSEVMFRPLARAGFQPPASSAHTRRFGTRGRAEKPEHEVSVPSAKAPCSPSWEQGRLSSNHIAVS